MSEAWGLHIYAALVKNLRGVIYSCLSGEELAERLSWLKKRFRYRRLGVTPSLLGAHKEVVDRFMGSPLVELRNPFPGLDELLSAYEELTGLSQAVLEAYCYSSIFVSPLLVLGRDCARELAPLVVDVVRVGRDLTDKDYKLHMRIADYTVLDFYPWATASARQALMALAQGLGAADILEERRRRIAQDKRRYWRVMSEGGRDFLLYLDLLPLLAERAGPEELRALLQGREELVPATLAIISAVAVP